MRIADFAEDGGVARAGGAGEIVCTLMECFVGEDGEAEGFFGVGGDAEGIGGYDLERRKERGEIGDEQRIARAATGEDEFRGALARKDEILNGTRDGSGSEGGRSVNQIVRRNAAAFGESDEASSVLGAEFFAASGFGRGFAEKRMGEELVEKFRLEMAAAGELGITVEAEMAASEMGGEGVDNHVARASVEGDDIARTRVRRNYSDVGDAADVQCDAAKSVVTIKQVINEWDEGSALAAGGHVGGAKIGDGGDAGAFGDDGRLGDLERGGSSSAEE